MITWHRNRGAPVDTHVLLYHSRKRPDWLEQCLASMEDEPTNIVLVDYPGSNVGAARAIGMREGTAPLLSFIDDDDFVLPGAFAACIAALDADPKLVGAYTDFGDVDCDSGELIRPPYFKAPWSPISQQMQPFEVLHVHVYRRAPSMKYLDEVAKWITLEESILMGLLVQDGDWLKLDFDGHRKRLHDFGAGSRVTPALLRRLGQRLGPILLSHPLARAASPLAKARATVVQAIDRADARDVGCSTCKKTRAAVRRLIS